MIYSCKDQWNRKPSMHFSLLDNRLKSTATAYIIPQLGQLQHQEISAACHCGFGFSPKSECASPLGFPTCGLVVLATKLYITQNNLKYISAIQLV